MPLRVAVIGVGHLGQHHARVLAALPDVELVGVADARIEQARLVAGRHGTEAFADYRDLIDRVARAVRKSRSNVMIEAASREAEDVLLNRVFFR